MKITQRIIPKSMWGIKCPHSMTPTYITIHNTANTASAAQEVDYLKRNKSATSCHIFVDESQAIQCLPLNRNGWHAGDGVNGAGNRRSIGIEICRSTDYATGRHRQAMLNAAAVVQQLMAAYNIPLSHVVQHNHWTGKNCPHRIREEGTWSEFLSLCAQNSAQEENKMEITAGKQTVRYNGKTYTIVKQADNEDVAIWSLKHPALAKLSQFSTAGVKPNFAKNLSFFVMDGVDRGQVCGSEISDIYDEAVPTEQNYIDVVKLKDGTWKFGNFGPYQYRADEVALRYSTGMVLVAGGAYSNEFSVPDGAGIKTKKVVMSCLFVDWSNVAYMVVSHEAVTPDEMRDFAMSLNMQYAFRDDSGGSAEIVEKGIVIAGARDEERALPNCLVFVPKKEIKPEPEEPAIPEDQTMIFKCVKASTLKGYPLRKSAPSGAIVSYLQPGENVKVVDIQNKGKNQYTSAAEPWCLTDYGLWFAYDKDYFE